jgi:protein SCO1/2
MPHARRVHAVVSLLATIAMTLPVSPARALEQENYATSPPATKKPFTLVAADGTVITDKTYRGKWVLIYFGYTFCPDICSTTLNAIAGALDALGPRAGQVQSLFITIDPKRDTPQVLARYVEAFDARIVALTGTPSQIGAAARAYGVIYERQDTDDGEYVYNHTSYIYLTDREGKLVEVVNGSADSATIVRRLFYLMRGENGAVPPN